MAFWLQGWVFGRGLVGLGLLCAWLGGMPALALSRVTLRNGFSYDCAREQVIDPAHTRLFLSQDADASYVDVATAEIAAVDALPALPAGAGGTLAPAAGPVGQTSRAAAEPAAQVARAVTDVGSLLVTAGAQHNIDVELLASLVHAESAGRARATSHAGAQGLMQLMPGTARTLGVTDSYAPDQNINGGTTYLDWLLTRYRDNLALALAAYNAGPGAVDRFHGIPPYRETRAYVVRVMTEFKRRKEALARKAPVGMLRASR